MVMLQIVIDTCCATFAEVQKRGEEFWSEFELYAADMLVGVVVNVALVGMLAPYARFGSRSASEGLLGRVRHAYDALPSRFVVNRKLSFKVISKAYHSTSCLNLFVLLKFAQPGKIITRNR